MERRKYNPGQKWGPDRLLKKAALLAPLAGILVFVWLYILAAATYPGGSYAEPEQEGFSYKHNYLCDLLDEVAINGEMNTSRFYARWALGILCASLLLLWYQLPKIFTSNGHRVFFIRVFGLLSFGVLVFLAEDTHDRTVRIAGVFGVLALLFCFIELYKAGYRKLFLLAVLNLLVFLLNYYIYETGTFLRALPMIQKFTFLLFLLWFVLLDLALYRKLEQQEP